MESQSSLAIVRLFRELKRRWWEGWHATPPQVRKSYLRTLAAGTAGLFVLMVLLMKLAQAQMENGSLEWEKPFLENMEVNPPFSFSTALWVQTFGTDITLWVLIFTTAGIFIWARRPLRALTMVLAYVGLDIIVRIGWGMWDRVRPDIIAEGFARPHFASFPSGHTGKTLVVYGVLCYLWANASRNVVEKIVAMTLPFLLTGIVGYGRMGMGVHWPSDVMAGAALGTFWLLVFIVALRLDNARTQSAEAAILNSSERLARVAR
jgi:membrane-associated phospholipid phosphatase